MESNQGYDLGKKKMLAIEAGLDVLSNREWIKAHPLEANNLFQTLLYVGADEGVSFWDRIKGLFTRGRGL
jgi:hypothetical protein